MILIFVYLYFYTKYDVKRHVQNINFVISFFQIILHYFNLFLIPQRRKLNPWFPHNDNIFFLLND